MTRFLRRATARALFAAVLACALPSFAAPPAVQPVMSLIPGDAMGGVVVTNMQELNLKISKLITQLGITRRYGIPLPPDLLAYGARVAGIDKALDFNASFAVFLWPSPVAQPTEKLPPETFEHGLFILPATDPDALIAPFSPQPADAHGIRQITIPLHGTPLFTAVINKKWVIAGPHIEDVQRYLKRTGPSLDADPAAVATFQQNDAVEWLHIPAILAATGQDASAITQALHEDAANITGDAFSRAIQHQLLDHYAPTLLDAAKDARDIFMTLHLDDDGIAVGFSGSAAKDSPTAKLLDSILTSSTASLDGLPDGRLVVASTFAVNGPAISHILAPLFTQILENPDVSADPRAAELRAGFDAATSFLAGFHSFKYAFYQTAPDANAGLFNGIALAEIDQPQKALDAITTLIAKVPRAPQTRPDGATMTPSFTPDALTVGGVHFARFQLTFTGNDGPDAMQSEKVATAMFGSNALTLYLGAMDNQLMGTFCTTPAQLQAAVTAAQSHSPALARRPEIKAAAALLPAHPVVVSYISLGGYVALLSHVYTVAGNPWGIDIEPLVAPAARMSPATVAIGYDAGTLGYRISLPASDAVGILAIVDNVRHAIAHDGTPPIP